MYKNNYPLSRQKILIYFKITFFTICLFPLLMHIYWGVFDILFIDNNVLFMEIFIFIGACILNINGLNKYFFKEKKYLYIFAIFLLIVLINSIILNNYKDFIKYLIYILLFYFIYSFYTDKVYFVFYINIVSFFTSINLILYGYSLISDFYKDFPVSELNLITQGSSFVIRTDWTYTIPYYLITIPLESFDSNQLSFLGLPRLFGMSTEPTLYSIVILPTLIMSVYYKKKLQSMILLLALILASSYGALTIGLVGILFYIFYKYKIYLLISLTVLFYCGYIFGFFIPLSDDSPRINLYTQLFLNFLNISNIYLFANLNYLYSEDIQMPFAILHQILEFGLMIALLYALILYEFVKLSFHQNNKLLFIFAIVVVMIINKSGEILSPLYLFYFSFLYSKSLAELRN